MFGLRATLQGMARPGPIPAKLPRRAVPIGSICRRNAVPIGITTALVEAVLAWRIGVDAALPAFLVLGAFGVVLGAVDLATKRLPDSLVLGSLGVGVALLGLAAAVAGDAGPLLRAAVGMVALFGLYLMLALVNPAGLGFGDVKLSAVLGLHLAWLGWDVLLGGALAGFALVALVALVLLAAGRVNRSTELPFGPFMLFGALLGVLTGGWLPN